jgi:hypothetical protein
MRNLFDLIHLIETVIADVSKHHRRVHLWVCDKSH